MLPLVQNSRPWSDICYTYVIGVSFDAETWGRVSGLGYSRGIGSLGSINNLKFYE